MSDLDKVRAEMIAAFERWEMLKSDADFASSDAACWEWSKLAAAYISTSPDGDELAEVLRAFHDAGERPSAVLRRYRDAFTMTDDCRPDEEAYWRMRGEVDRELDRLVRGARPARADRDRLNHPGLRERVAATRHRELEHLLRRANAVRGLPSG